MSLGKILLKEELDIREYDYLARLKPSELYIQAPVYFNGKLEKALKDVPAGYLGPYFNLKMLPVGFQEFSYYLLASFVPNRTKYETDGS